jgi:hypothetical protein
MSATPRTDAETGYFELNKCEVNYRNEPYVKTEFARVLERELADISHAYGVTRDVVKGLCEELANLKAENAALREAFAKADVLAEYMRSDGRRGWQTIECWVYPNDIIVQMDRAAFDAARKEAKP